MNWKGSLSLALLSCVAASHASIVGVGGSSVLVAAPADATLNQYTHATQVRVWNELQNFSLPVNITADAVAPGVYNMPSDLGSFVISNDTRVNSHYIHFDTPAAAAGNAEGSVTFDGVILGVFARGDDSSFTRLDDTDFLSSGTLYDNGLNARGLEFAANGNGDRFAISADGLTLSYRFGITEPGDRIRVVTAVPEPASLAILGLGAASLLRRRRAR